MDQNTIIITALILIALLLLRQSFKGRVDRKLISNDDLTLYSERLKLIGRPDRIIEENGAWIPIEKKSATKIQHSHIMQLVIYLILIEDITGKRPPYGQIVLRNNRIQNIENTKALRDEAWAHIRAVQAIKPDPQGHVKASAFPAKCKSCGYKSICKQAKLS